MSKKVVAQLSMFDVFNVDGQVVVVLAVDLLEEVQLPLDVTLSDELIEERLSNISKEVS